MEIPQIAIEKAIEGGWKVPHVEAEDELPSAISFYLHEWQKVALDPTFWQALGKACGWFSVFPTGHCQVCGEPMPKGEEMFNYHGYSSDCPKPSKIKRYWGDEGERFVHLILQGKDTTDYWTEILK